MAKTSMKPAAPRKLPYMSSKPVNIDDFLDDPLLWELRAQAMQRFQGCLDFDRDLAGLLEDRYRKIEDRRTRYFIPALWVLYAGYPEYRVTGAMLDCERNRQRVRRGEASRDDFHEDEL